MTDIIVTLTFPQMINAEIGIPVPSKGDAATVTIGSVTTGEPGSGASVTNVGNWNAAVLNFSIPRGESGKNLAIKGTYSSYSEFIAMHPVGELGDAYGIGTQTDFHLYIWDTLHTVWVDCGTLFEDGQLQALVAVLPIDGGDFFTNFFKLNMDGGTF
jgi:hypothetical protein